MKECEDSSRNERARYCHGSATMNDSHVKRDSTNTFQSPSPRVRIPTAFGQATKYLIELLA